MVKRTPDGSRQPLATLLMNAPIRALEISRTGCLLESRYPIEVGSAGQLRLAIDGRTYCEEARITRCQRVEGAGAGYRLGVEFLRTRRPSSSSLRRVLYALLDIKDENNLFVAETNVV